MTAPLARVQRKLDRARVLLRLSTPHPGYEPDWDHHRARIDGWYCVGAACGQPLGKPHLDRCDVARAIAEQEAEG